MSQSSSLHEGKRSYSSPPELLFNSTSNLRVFWESVYGLKPRPAQEELMKRLQRNAVLSENCIHQAIMGSGKSSIIMPYLIIDYLQDMEKSDQLLDFGLYIMVVQPKHLTESTLERLISLHFINFVIVRYGLHDVYQMCRKPGQAIVHIMNDTDIKRFYLKVKPGEFQPDVLLIDEFDSICMPCKSDYNVCHNEKPGYGPSISEELLHWFHYYLPKYILKKNCTWFSSEVRDKVCVTSRDKDMFESWIAIYKTVRYKWVYNVRYGYRHTGPKATPFVVPYVTTKIPHESSEFKSNDVKFIATCIGLTNYDGLLNIQTDSLRQVFERKQKLGVNDDETDQQYLYITEYLFSQLFYSTEMLNINMVDILYDIHQHHQKKNHDMIVYAFSGTVAIPVHPKLRVNCIVDDQYMKDVDELIKTSTSKMVNMTIKNQWNILPSYDVFIDAYGFWRIYDHETAVINLHKHVKREIVYIDAEHKVRVYPSRSLYVPEGDSNTFRNEKNYFFYFDHAHTVGTDVKHPSELKVLVMTHKTNLFSQVAQAMYRIRGIKHVSFATSSIKPHNFYDLWVSNQAENVKTNKTYMQKQVDTYQSKLTNQSYMISMQDNDPIDVTLLLEEEKEQEREQENELQMVRHLFRPDKRIKKPRIAIDEWDHNVIVEGKCYRMYENTFISEYCKKFIRESRLLLCDVLLLTYPGGTMIFHFDELNNIIGNLHKDKHCIYHAFGHMLYPYSNSGQRKADVAIMLNLPTVTLHDIRSLLKTCQKQNMSHYVQYSDDFMASRPISTPMYSMVSRYSSKDEPDLYSETSTIHFIINTLSQDDRVRFVRSVDPIYHIVDYIIDHLPDQ